MKCYKWAIALRSCYYIRQVAAACSGRAARFDVCSTSH